MGGPGLGRSGSGFVGVIGFGWIDWVRLDRRGQRRGRLGPGGSIDQVLLDRHAQRRGDRVRVDRSIRFYWIGTLSGGAIGSGWIDRSGSTGSARSAAGRSGPGGSIDQVLLDRHAQRRGDRVRVDRSIRFYWIGTLSGGAIGSGWIDRSGSTGSPRSAAGAIGFKWIDRSGSTGSPRSAAGRSGPGGKRHSNPRNTPNQPSPRFNPRKRGC